MSAANVTSASPATYDVEFRAIPDDAWYSVLTLFDGEKLTLKNDNFTDDDESIFRPQDFKSLQEIEDFKGRFRPISVQLQDNECKSLVEGMVVCASCCFTELDVRFYDAFVDDVINRDHSFNNGEEQCTCTFVVIWKHGPVAGCLANRKVENICLPQSSSDLDPNVACFLELVGKKLETAANGPHLISSRSTIHEHITSLPLKPQSIFTPQFNKGVNCAGLPVTSKWKSQGLERVYSFSGRVKEETDTGGNAYQYFVIENLDKDLSPSTVVGFIRRQTSISVQAYVFPSLPSETYTKGILALDCQKDLQKLCEFLDSPNQIVVSRRGRPWVLTKKIAGNSTYAVSFGTLMTKYQLEDKGIGTGCIKVVHFGSEEYEIAKQLRDMFMEFVEHQERLHRTLASEENKIARQTSAR